MIYATDFIQTNKHQLNRIESKLDDKDWSKIQVLGQQAEIGTIKDVANFENIVNNIFGKNSNEANKIIEYANNLELYLKDPREIRSYNAENLIQNTGNLEDALLNRANELKGKINGLTKSSNKQISKTVQPDLSRSDGSKSDNAKYDIRKQKSDLGHSSTNSGRNKIWESKSSEQPIGLKDIKKYKFNASKYRKYSKASGLSPKEWIENIRKTKKYYGLTDQKAISLVNRATAQLKTMADETEKLLIKRGIITKEQAANRKKMVGSNN